MRKRRVIILAVAVVTVLGGVIWWTVDSLLPSVPNPVYAGHPLGYWLTPSSLTGTNGVAQQRLVESSLDSNAVPYLVRALKTRNGTLRTAYIRAWPRFAAWLKRCVPEPADAVQVRTESCEYLRSLGAAARPAIPELIRVLREDEDPWVRNMAATALGEIANGDDKPVLEALVAAAKRTGIARQTAARYLWRLNPEAAARERIRNPTPGTSPTTNSAGAVAVVASVSLPTTPGTAQEVAVNDGRPIPQWFGEIVGTNSLESKDRATAQHTSAQNDVMYHDKSINIWFNELASTDLHVRSAASLAFANIGSDALPFLMAQAEFLGGLRETNAQAFTASTNAMRGYDAVQSAFRALGPAGKPAEPELVDAFEKERYETLAGKLLEEVDPTNAVIIFTHGLTDRLLGVRQVSAAYLCDFTNIPDPEIVVSGLLQCLNDETSGTNSVWLRITAANSLGHLKLSPERVVPALLQRLEREDALPMPNSPIRNEIIIALGKFGGKARSAVPTLQSLTNVADSKSPMVSRAAVNALKRIEAQK